MSSAKRLWPEDVVGHGFRVVREADYDALDAECQRLRSALKEAFEEGFSEGNRQSDDRYHWKGYQRELAESWETSDAKKIAALAGSKEGE